MSDTLMAAAEQALEALEADPDAMVEVTDHHWHYKRDLAIEALRAALAAPAVPAVPAVPAPAEPVTLADILDALNVFNRPKPSEDDGPWEAEHFIRVDHLPAFINIIAAAWFATPKPQAAQPSAEPVAWLAKDRAGHLFIVGGNGPHDIFGGFPVYAASQAAAQPLTDADIILIYQKWDATPGASYADLIRAVERFHGIGNGDA